MRDALALRSSGLMGNVVCLESDGLRWVTSDGFQVRLWTLSAGHTMGLAVLFIKTWRVYSLRGIKQKVKPENRGPGSRVDAAAGLFNFLLFYRISCSQRAPSCSGFSSWMCLFWPSGRSWILSDGWSFSTS